MLTWRTRPGLYKMASQQFLETGGPPPKGVNQVARYHVPGSVLGWHVLETDDMTALCEHVNNWGDLIDMNVGSLHEALRLIPRVTDPVTELDGLRHVRATRRTAVPYTVRFLYAFQVILFEFRKSRVLWARAVSKPSSKAASEYLQLF